MPKKGEKHSSDTIRKISISRRGKPAWNKNINWKDINKRKMSIGRRGVFNWIKEKKLRDMLIRDYATAVMCEEQELYKPAIILYSALLEAILLYKLKIENLDFSQLITKAQENKLIGVANASKLNVLRDFRNYIHIKKELKSDYNLTKGTAEFAKEICESVFAEITQS